MLSVQEKVRRMEPVSGSVLSEMALEIVPAWSVEGFHSDGGHVRKTPVTPIIQKGLQASIKVRASAGPEAGNGPFRLRAVVRVRKAGEGMGGSRLDEHVRHIE